MKSSLSIVSRLGQILFPYRLFVGLAVVVPALGWLSPRPFLIEPYRNVQLFGLFTILFGLGLRAWAAGCAGAHTRSKIIEAPSLITNGPFAHVRNPIYLGTLIIGLGMSILIVDPWAYLFSAVAFAILYLTIIPAEEKFLRGLFGAEYQRYCKSVPRLFPRFSAWKQRSRGIFHWSSTWGELRIASIIAVIYVVLTLVQRLKVSGVP